MKHHLARRFIPSRKAGLSLIDLWGGLVLLVVGVTALAGVFLSESRLSNENHATALLTLASRNIVETLRAEDFAILTQDYGTGTANPGFWTTQSGDIVFTDPGDSTVSGTIEFFNDESSIPAAFGGLASSFDLNSNGSIDGTPVTDYRVLPTRITLNVSGDNPRSITVDMILSAGRAH